MALKMKRSAVAGKVPQVSDLDLGELALNTRDGRLFFKTDDGTPAIVEAAMAGHTHALAEITDLPAGELVTTAGTQSLSNKTLTSPKLALGADATGDLSYRDSTGHLTRLGIGASDQVLTVFAGLPAWRDAPSPPTTLGGIGTYAFLCLVGGGLTSPGDTRPGSSLFYANAASDASYTSYCGAKEQSPPGTWRCMGNTGYYKYGSYSSSSSNNFWATTLWMRIA